MNIIKNNSKNITEPNESNLIYLGQLQDKQSFNIVGLIKLISIMSFFGMLIFTVLTLPHPHIAIKALSLFSGITFAVSTWWLEFNGGITSGSFPSDPYSG